MASLNKVQLIGRLTFDPDPPRTLGSGSTVVHFKFAVGRSRKNQQTGQWENDPNPLFIECEAWTSPNTKRDLCNVVSQFLRKGSQVYLEGRLQLDSWEDKNGGGKRSKHKLVVENLELLDSRSDSGQSNYGGGGGGRSQDDDYSSSDSFSRGGGNPPARSGGSNYSPPPARNNDSFDNDNDYDEPSGGDIPF